MMFKTLNADDKVFFNKFKIINMKPRLLLTIVMLANAYFFYLKKSNKIVSDSLSNDKNNKIL
jgi:hypothetical protein